MDKRLILLRAIPGAGKSTFAKLLFELDPENTVICEADKYHMNGDKYEWKPEKVRYSHDMCQADCESAMEDGIRTIIVSNTSTTEKEVKPYLLMAARHNYSIISLVVENRHGNTSIHNVPVGTLEAMEKRFQFKLR